MGKFIYLFLIIFLTGCSEERYKYIESGRFENTYKDKKSGRYLDVNRKNHKDGY
ncbi:hypothetical protein KMW28_23260 [Flammeovirga yaeyamensis]|uniref:Lipoprotein n=1 Tax=Flammeovirga yaeyamensis TaxID=367791 RepID=A0AAX1NFH8_9BACT|nr:hypothetical protein [Flammeovirga yaeyamensis]MBB3696712.1 hypothetical protein [Flammeovirga yaeyamensis]QWG05343.1 hypothetical protein KMW28_23260 [Flammeovirga yaeyamensis]